METPGNAVSQLLHEVVSMVTEEGKEAIGCCVSFVASSSTSPRSLHKTKLTEGIGSAKVRGILLFDGTQSDWMIQSSVEIAAVGCTIRLFSATSTRIGEEMCILYSSLSTLGVCLWEIWVAYHEESQLLTLPNPLIDSRCWWNFYRTLASTVFPTAMRSLTFTCLLHRVLLGQRFDVM